MSGSPELLRAFHEFPPLAINSNATLYTLRLHASEYPDSVGEGERRLIYVTGGTLRINHEYVRKGGHARIEGKEKLRLATEDEAEIILISMWE